METRTFVEGFHTFWCGVEEEKAGVFACDVTFVTNSFNGPPRIMRFKLNGFFARAEVALGVSERYGRNMIRRHGDVVAYLAAKE